MVYALFAKKVWKQAFIYFLHCRVSWEVWSRIMVCVCACAHQCAFTGPCLFVIVMGSSVGRVMFWVCSVKGGFGLVVVVSGWGGFAYWVFFSG